MVVHIYQSPKDGTYTRRHVARAQSRTMTPRDQSPKEDGREHSQSPEGWSLLQAHTYRQSTQSRTVIRSTWCSHCRVARAQSRTMTRCINQSPEGMAVIIPEPRGLENTRADAPLPAGAGPDAPHGPEPRGDGREHSQSPEGWSLLQAQTYRQSTQSRTLIRCNLVLTLASRQAQSRTVTSRINQCHIARAQSRTMMRHTGW